MSDFANERLADIWDGTKSESWISRALERGDAYRYVIAESIGSTDTIDLAFENTRSEPVPVHRALYTSQGLSGRVEEGVDGVDTGTDLAPINPRIQDPVDTAAPLLVTRNGDYTNPTSGQDILFPSGTGQQSTGGSLSADFILDPGATAGYDLDSEGDGNEVYIEVVLGINADIDPVE